MNDLDKLFIMCYTGDSSIAEFDARRERERKEDAERALNHDKFMSQEIEVKEIRDENDNLLGFYEPTIFDLTNYPNLKLQTRYYTRKQLKAKQCDGPMPLKSYKNLTFMLRVDPDQYGKTALSIHTKYLTFPSDSLELSNVEISTHPDGPSPYYSSREGTFYNVYTESGSCRMTAPIYAERDWYNKNVYETVTLKFDDLTNECITNPYISLRITQYPVDAIIEEPALTLGGLSNGRFF